MDVQRGEEIKEHGRSFVIWRNFPLIVRIAKFSNHPLLLTERFEIQTFGCFDARTASESHESENAKSHWLHLLNFSPLMCVFLAHLSDHLPIFQT